MYADLSKLGRCESKLSVPTVDGRREGARVRICDGDDWVVALWVVEGRDRY